MCKMYFKIRKARVKKSIAEMGNEDHISIYVYCVNAFRFVSNFIINDILCLYICSKLGTSESTIIDNLAF